MPTSSCTCVIRIRGHLADYPVNRFTVIFYERVPTFRDSPALRVAKALASMCIALAIAFAFQYLINRAPARKLLRQSTADLMASVSAYYILHTAYVAARK